MNPNPLPKNDETLSSEHLHVQQENMEAPYKNPHLSNRYLYHITDRDNLASIVRQGLRSASSQPELEAKGDIQVKHLPSFFKKQPYENRIVSTDENGKEYHIDDCVHFLFAAKDPRLFSIINSKNIDQDRIIFLLMRVDKVSKLGGSFSDRYTKATDYLRDEEPKIYNDLAQVSKVLDWEVIDSAYMGTKDIELKVTLTFWPRMAQAFVPEKVDFSEIEAIVVYDEAIKSSVREELNSLGVDNAKVKIFTEAEATDQLPNHPKFYFFKEKILGHEMENLVTGPRELYHLFKECISEIKKIRNQRVDSDSQQYIYRFDNVESLVKAIEKDFRVLPELKGIYKLETDTQAHHEDVGAHTLSTVRNLEDSKYYQNADAHMKSVLKLSAYLHDIGKGPREKWPERVQHRYPDHPRDSISMLKRILTEEIKNLSDKDIHDICLMVIYHDAVGECENKGRSYQEVANIVECDDDLEMLYCISEADIRSIQESWYEKFMSLEEEFKEDIRKIKNQDRGVCFP